MSFKFEMLVKKNYKYFETHIHFGSEEFRNQVNDQLQLEPSFQYLNVATSLEDSSLVAEQSSRSNRMFCSVGIHPLYIPDNYEDIKEKINVLEKLILENDQVVAIGECGLDFYRAKKEEALETQVKWLKAQLELAEKFRLPVIMHLRSAYSEALELLKEYPNFRGIIHSFDGTPEEAKELLNLSGDCFISFSPLVFRNISKFREIMSLVPMERILVESDSPYLAGGASICRSIVKLTSEFKKIPLEKARKQIYINSLKAFNLLEDL